MARRPAASGDGALACLRAPCRVKGLASQIGCHPLRHPTMESHGGLWKQGRLAVRLTTTIRSSIQGTLELSKEIRRLVPPTRRGRNGSKGRSGRQRITRLRELRDWRSENSDGIAENRTGSVTGKRSVVLAVPRPSLSPDRRCNRRGLAGVFIVSDSQWMPIGPSGRRP